MFEDDSDKDKRKQSLLSHGPPAPESDGARSSASILAASGATTENDPALRHRLARSRREAGPSPLLSALAAMEGFRAEPAVKPDPHAKPRKSRWSFRNLLSPRLKIGEPDVTITLVGTMLGFIAGIGLGVLRGIASGLRNAGRSRRRSGATAQSDAAVPELCDPEPLQGDPAKATQETAMNPLARLMERMRWPAPAEAGRSYRNPPANLQEAAPRLDEEPAATYPYPAQPPQPAFHAWKPQPMAYEPYGRAQQGGLPYPAYPMKAPQAPAAAYPQAAQPGYAPAAEPHLASLPREMSPIEEVRESLREFRDAIRDLTESRARRSQ